MGAQGGRLGAHGCRLGAYGCKLGANVCTPGCRVAGWVPGCRAWLRDCRPHLGEEIDLGHLELYHGRQGHEEHRDELGRIRTVVRVDQVNLQPVYSSLQPVHPPCNLCIHPATRASALQPPCIPRQSRSVETRPGRARQRAAALPGRGAILACGRHRDEPMVVRHLQRLQHVAHAGMVRE